MERESINKKGKSPNSIHLLWIHKKEIDMYLMESTSFVERLSAFWATSILLSIGPMH